MKAEYIYLADQDKVREAIDRILVLETGNKYLVTISNAGDKTAKQHRYQWRLYQDISRSALGGKYEETPESVHRFCKYKFALPVILENDDNFRWLYESVKKELFNDEEKMMWFVDSQVSTMDFNVIEGMDYITDMINYYAPRGFELTDPREYGLKRAA